MLDSVRCIMILVDSAAYPRAKAIANLLELFSCTQFRVISSWLKFSTSESTRHSLVNFEPNVAHQIVEESKWATQKLNNERSLSMTHDSFRAEDKSLPTYQRLEWCGDSVLNFVTSNYLFAKYPDDDEASLTCKRSNLTDKNMLRQISDKLKISEYIRFAESVQKQRSPYAFRSYECFVEALIGTIYMDGGLEAAGRFIQKLWNLSEPVDGNRILDAGVQFLARSLTNENIRFRCLYLNSVGMSDVGCEYLAEMLRVNHSMLHLYLNDNDISDRGLQLLLDTTNSHKNGLKTMTLNDNRRITDASVDIIWSYMPPRNGFNQLTVRNCSISEAAFIDVNEREHVFVPFGNDNRLLGYYEDFLYEFLVDWTGTRTLDRPVGILEMKNGSLLISDDGNGCLCRIEYTRRKKELVIVA
ncbi:hypothetical protein I4U23_027209 [Adineta vaga]|nr:hypothetical protein I4U23_027209 [Adineta vaga]